MEQSPTNWMRFIHQGECFRKLRSPLRLSASVEMTLVEVATLGMTGTLLITFWDVDNSVDKFFKIFC